MFIRYKFRNIILFLIAFLIAGIVFWNFNIKNLNNNKDNSYNIKIRNDINVVVSVVPIYYIVRDIVDNRVNVVLIKNINDANNFIKNNKINLWYIVGEGVDDWVNNFIKSNNIKSINLLKDVHVQELEHRVEIGKLKDKHYYWFSFDNAKNIAIAISRELGKIDVVGKDYYINNAFEYAKELEKEKNVFKKRLNNKIIKKTEMFALDNYFDEFLKSFDINVLGLFMIDEDNKVDELDSLKYNLIYYNVKTLLVPIGYDYQFELDSLVNKIKNVKIIKLDPLGENDYKNFIDFMRYNFSTFLTGMLY